MDFNIEEIREVMQEHRIETGIDFDDFVDIFACQIQHPEVFDIFFELPYNYISETSKDFRIELLIDVFTT